MNKLTVIIIALVVLNIVIFNKKNYLKEKTTAYTSVLEKQALNKVSNLDFDFSKNDYSEIKQEKISVDTLHLIFEQGTCWKHWKNWNTLEEMSSLVNMVDIKVAYIKIHSDSISFKQVLSELSTECEWLKELVIEGQYYIKKSTFWKDENKNTIDYLPDTIGYFSDLEILRINNTGIYELSNEVIGLRGLKTLDLANNELNKFPDVLKHLPNLERLNLSHNNLGLLENFYLAYDMLDFDREETLNFFTEKPFEKLKYLDVSYNKLQYGIIPRQMLNLTELNLSYNSINELSESIVQFEKLKILDLSVNSLRAIPSVLQKISSLEILYFVKKSYQKKLNWEASKFHFTIKDKR